MDNNNIYQREVASTLYEDSCHIIEEARTYAFRAINTALTLRNWKLGERISHEHLEDDGRAEYGKYVIKSLSDKLTDKYGKGFDSVSLYNYIKFYRLFPKIVDAPSQQSKKVDAESQQLLPWTHYRELIRVENTEARTWYEQEAKREMWSSRTLHRNISSQYYYRLIQSQEKAKVTDEMHRLTTSSQRDKLEYIKNPVVAEFLGFPTDINYTESDLEKSIIEHIQHFIMEMGKGFAFVARQKHIRTDMARYSVLHGNEQLFQAKYLLYLPSKEELIREIEIQKEIFRLQKE